MTVLPLQDAVHALWHCCITGQELASLDRNCPQPDVVIANSKLPLLKSSYGATIVAATVD